MQTRVSITKGEKVRERQKCVHETEALRGCIRESEEKKEIKIERDRERRCDEEEETARVGEE